MKKSSALSVFSKLPYREKQGIDVPRLLRLMKNGLEQKIETIYAGPCI